MLQIMTPKSLYKRTGQKDQQQSKKEDSNTLEFSKLSLGYLYDIVGPF